TYTEHLPSFVHNSGLGEREREERRASAHKVRATSRSRQSSLRRNKKKEQKKHAWAG
ncbi:unnamed protein product, partial [Ectocarpus sp. 12 AP-2014]